MAQRFEYLSAQFDPASIRRVAAEIDRQKTAKRDYVLPTSRLAFDDAGRLMIQGKTFTVGGRTFLEWSDAEAESDRVRQAVLSSDTQDPAEVADAIANAGKITVSNESGSIELKPTALSQLFGRLEIPKRFADKLTANGNGDLLASLTTGLLGRDSRRLMLRCLDGRVRAVVSDRYRRLDNDDLFYAAASRFRDTGATLWKARLSDDGFEMFGVADHIAGEVRLDRPFDPGDGWLSRWAGRSGDVQNAAVRIVNSETGRGGLNVNLSIVTKICANFCVWGEGVSAIHSGRAIEADDDGLIVSDETREKESAVIWSKINDAISTAFNAERFQKLLDRMNDATQVEIPADRIEAVVDNVVAKFSIAEDAKRSILDELLATGDRSQYGLAQSVTNAAHASDRAGKPEAASEFETIGAAILETPKAAFEKLFAIA